MVVGSNPAIYTECKHTFSSKVERADSKGGNVVGSSPARCVLLPNNGRVKMVDWAGNGL